VESFQSATCNQTQNKQEKTGMKKMNEHNQVDYNEKRTKTFK